MLNNVFRTETGKTVYTIMFDLKTEKVQLADDEPFILRDEVEL